MSRLLPAIAAMFILASGIAQEPRFIQHDLGDENVGVPMHAVMQDHQCMIWLGTARGLMQYDGMVLRPISVSSPDTAIQVTALFEDKDSRIWIGTASGSIFYLDKTRKAHAFDIEEGNPAKSITAITQDAQGFIWFATYGEGVYVYTGSRLFNIGVDDGLQGEDIYTMICTPDGKIWLGTDDGINICTFQQETKRIEQLGLKDGLPDQIITALEADEHGNVWIGTFEFGVVYYDAVSGKISRPFDQQQMDAITSFTIFDGKEVWIGTNNSGVWRYSDDHPFARRFENLQGFKFGRISDLLSDLEGNIWLATEEGKLFSAFRPFESLEVNIPEIQALHCDHLDQLWIGTKKGLYRIEAQSLSASRAIRVLPQVDFNIKDLFEDAFYNIWIGTLDEGLYVYQPSSGKLRHIGPILDNGGITIMSVAATKKEIWLATLEGVVHFPADRNIMKENQSAFQALRGPLNSNLPFVNQVFVDSKDRPWFAMNGEGVYCLDGNNFIQYKGNDSLEIKIVNAVCEDDQGHYWFNTIDLGLVELIGTQYKPLGIKEGLDNMSLGTIRIADNGEMIIMHDRGIDLMEPARRHFMYYNDEIGITETEAGFNTGTSDSKGNTYISGLNVIFKYFSTEHKLSIDPRTQLTQVTVFDKPIDFTEVHSFTYAHNYISFSYVGLWYISPSSVKYRYKLEGYDLQWKESKDNVASYSSLPPGTYTFVVMASENNFFLDEPSASYTFTIAKPFWRQFWFIGLLTALSAGILYWWVKSREKRFARQALQKKDMIESQLAALKAQINPHFLFNSFNTLITIIDENAMQPEVAIEYVEKLSDFYRSILQYREQESISLEEEWELVQSFVYLLEKRYGTNLTLHIDTPPRDGFIMPMTLQMLVENAVKHNIISEKYPLDLYITVDADDYVTVRNTLQPKSKAEPSTQFGLDSIIRRYQLLSGRKVIIEKTNDAFIVRIPIIKKSLS